MRYKNTIRARLLHGTFVGEKILKKDDMRAELDAAYPFFW